MANEELANLTTARTDILSRHFNAKMTTMEKRFASKLFAMQAHIYGNSLFLKSDMLDLNDGIPCLRNTVSAQAKALDERR